MKESSEREFKYLPQSCSLIEIGLRFLEMYLLVSSCLPWRNHQRPHRPGYSPHCHSLRCIGHKVPPFPRFPRYISISTRVLVLKIRRFGALFQRALLLSYRMKSLYRMRARRCDWTVQVQRLVQRAFMRCAAWPREQFREWDGVGDRQVYAMRESCEDCNPIIWKSGKLTLNLVIYYAVGHYRYRIPGTHRLTSWRC